jgi:hypothetical protein
MLKPLSCLNWKAVEKPMYKTWEDYKGYKIRELID